MVAVDEVAANLLDAAVDNQVVVSGGDDQVGLFQCALFIHLVVVDEDAAGRLGHADSFEGIHSSAGAYVFLQNRRVVEEGFHAFQSVECFNEARIVVVKSALHDVAKALVKLH